MKVEIFNDNKNHYHIYGEGIHKLQSYNSIVVKISSKTCDPVIVLGRYWDYSKTTLRFVYKFLEQFTDINFGEIKDKKKYINELISKNIIHYDENME